MTTQFEALAKTLLVAIVCILVMHSPGNAAKKAIVIGNNLYRFVVPLQKAAGDARVLSEKLTSLGYTVTTGIDLSRSEMNEKISEFIAGLAPDDTVVFHFSGHGIEIDGDNYLLPVDVPNPDKTTSDFIADESISLANLIARLTRSPAGVKILIIDACRDNPFAKPGLKSLGSARGLGRIDAPRGTFILYSAGYEQSALDRLGDSDSTSVSVYTRVLLDQLSIRGKDIRQLAFDTRKSVEALARTVSHEQTPAYYDELPERFSLNGDYQPVLEDAQNSPASPPAAATDKLRPNDTTTDIDQAIGLAANSSSETTPQATIGEESPGSEASDVNIDPPDDSQFIKYIVLDRERVRVGDTFTIRLKTFSSRVRVEAVVEKSKGSFFSVKGKYQPSRGGIYVNIRVPENAEPGTRQVKLYVREIGSATEDKVSFHVDFIR